MSVRGYIVITFEVTEEDGAFSSVCPETGTASFGDTVEDAVANLRDALDVHLKALEQLGQRDRFFREHGIVVHRKPQERVRKAIRPKFGQFITLENLAIGA